MSNRAFDEVQAMIDDRYGLDSPESIAAKEAFRVYLAWLDAPENKVRAHGAIDNILSQLESWGKAYPTDIFREITDEDREWLHSTRPGLMDRIAAGMGRHMHKMIEKDIAALSNALRALNHDQ